MYPRHTVPAKRRVPGIDDSRLSVIILAAGMGKRLKSYGPKCLFGLGNKTIIERQIDTILHIFPKSDIFIVVGFESNKIRTKVKDKYPVRIVYNPIWEETNVMFSAALGLQALTTTNVLLIHGDLVFNAEALYGITNRGSRLLVDTSRQLSGDEVGLIFEQNSNLVTNISYGLPIKWGQIAYLEGKEFKTFEKVAYNYDLTSRWFLYEGLNRIIESKGRLRIHAPNGLQLEDIDTMKDLEKVKRI